MLGSAGVPAQELFRPPAPLPCAEPLGPIALLKALWKNPLEAWTQAHFEEPIVVTNLALGQIAVVSEPAAIRRVLLDNSGQLSQGHDAAPDHVGGVRATASCLPSRSSGGFSAVPSHRSSRSGT